MRKMVDGLSLDIPSDVYDPAEDSFLLAENVQDLIREQEEWEKKRTKRRKKK